MPDQFDVLVIGAGAAGLYASLCLPSSFRVGLISKDPLSRSASDWAQGGIAAVINPDDSPALHIADTLQAGVGLCEAVAVKVLVEKAPACIQALLQMGVAFDRHGDQLALTLEAAHSRRRVLHAADTTGRAVVTVLANQVLNRPNIQVFSPAIALDLWLTSAGDRCQGISLAYQGNIHWLKAGAIVLATGGGGQVFSQTTNPTLSTGDGVAMAWRSGAILRDLEFVQFHPTALFKTGAPRFLISEAVRGEGAHLLDSQGKRFTFDYHPSGELAPRDVVSRAIFSHLQKTGESNAWLDLRSLPPERIQQRFPNIIRVCQKWGVDVFSEPIPVTPAAHYWMGGIATDSIETSIPGLYTVGEVASTGVHGANRLASNSLLECLVFGAELGNLSLPPVMESSDESATLPKKLPILSEVTNLDLNQLQTLRTELPQLVWHSAGICREQESLKSAIAQVQTWQQEFANMPISQHFQQLPPGKSIDCTSLNLTDEQVRLWSETRNLLNIGYLILNSALFRTESRGGHYRSDFPQTDPNWQTHTLVQHQQWWQSSPINTSRPSSDQDLQTSS